MKTYQEFNESLTDWYNKGRNVRVPNEDKASFKTLRQDDSNQQGKFIKPESKGKEEKKLSPSETSKAKLDAARKKIALDRKVEMLRRNRKSVPNAVADAITKTS